MSLKKSVYIIIFILFIIFFMKNLDIFEDDFYENINIIKNPNNQLVLVNKNNQLPKNFIPLQLVLIDEKFATKDKYMQKEAANSFESLSRDANILGYKIIAVSTYRNYEYQEKLYNDYIKKDGKNYADNCCARPGHSEHQTGLAVDVMGSNNDYNKFEESNEFEWMKNNAHLYGFILRYPKNKNNITGFKYEPWHYRYVGVYAAKIIYTEKITLEEYVNNYIKKKDN